MIILDVEDFDKFVAERENPSAESIAAWKKVCQRVDIRTARSQLERMGYETEARAVKAQNAQVQALKLRNEALKAALKEVRDNMSARAVCGFHDGSYAVSGDTITMLVLEKRELEAENAALREVLETIEALPSHRNMCCPTNPAKNLARKALQESCDE